MYANKFTEQIKNQMFLIQQQFPIKLRDYQNEIIIETFETILENLENNEKSSILIEAPTGAGKTVIGLFIVKMLETFYFPKCNTNWCAMRRELLTQAKEANCENFKFNNNMNYVSLFSSDVPSGEILVMDEAHHDSTFSGANIHKMSQSKIIIGLTATPARSDQVDLYFIKKIHSANTQRLVNEGYLMKYDHFFISDWNTDLIVDSYISNKEIFGQTVFFVKNYVECEELTRKLKEKNVNVEMIHSKLNNKLREEFVKSFKNKKIDCLVNINVLTEGFDYDDLKTVFCRPSQKSLTKQMAGRVLRLSELFSHVNVVQSTDSHFKYCNEVAPNNTYKYYTEDSSWRSDDLDLKEIDNFIDSQNLSSMIELQKKNGMEKEANQLLGNLETRLKENKNYELCKKAVRELNELNLEFLTAQKIRNLIYDISHEKEVLIKKGKDYILEYDVKYFRKISKELQINQCYRIAKVLAARIATNEDIEEAKKVIVKKVSKDTNNNQSINKISIDDEISKIKEIMMKP